VLSDPSWRIRCGSDLEATSVLEISRGLGDPHKFDSTLMSLWIAADSRRKMEGRHVDHQVGSRSFSLKEFAQSETSRIKRGN